MRQENGDVIRLAPGKPKKLGSARVGRLILDGDVILPADGSTMNERRRLALNGLVAAAVAVDGQGRMRGKPQIRMEGLPIEEDREDKLPEAIRRGGRRAATTWTGKKPVVEVLVVRVP